MSEHVQLNLRGQPVTPEPMRDMLLSMWCWFTRAELSEYSPQVFGPETCAAAGVMDFEEAQKIFDEMIERDYVQPDRKCQGAYVFTAAGRGFLEGSLRSAELPDLAWYDNHERETWKRSRSFAEAAKQTA